MILAWASPFKEIIYLDCSEPSLADRARHREQDRAWDDGRVHWLVEHSATSMLTLAYDTCTVCLFLVAQPSIFNKTNDFHCFI